MKELFTHLRGQDVLFESCDQEVVASENFSVVLVKKLMKSGISALLAFKTVACEDTDSGKADQILLQSVCEAILATKEASVKIVVTSSTKNYLFCGDGRQQDLLYTARELSVFDRQECVRYLQTPCAEASNYSYLAQNKFPDKAKVKDLIQVGTEEVVEYFDRNPLCLKVAKQYCSTYMISYADFLDNIKTSNKEFIQEVCAKLLEDPKDKASFLAMHNVLKMQKKLGLGEKKLHQILQVLALISHEDIPVLFIGRVCQFLRDFSHETVKDISLKNQHEASDVVVYMQNKCTTSSVQFTYPDGCITMKQNIHKSYYDPDDITSLGVAVKAMLSILSKDNTQRIADRNLYILHPHIQSLVSFAKKVSINEGVMNEKTSENIGLILSICRLDEIYAQALTQSRAAGKWRVSLEVLHQAVTSIYDIVCYFSTSSWPFCGFFGVSASQEDLAFEVEKNAEIAGKKIANQCIKAGQQCGDYFEEYVQTSVVLNMQNINDFLAYLTQVKQLPMNEARSKIQNVIDATKDSIALTPQLIEILRSNGLFLTRDEMLKSFFSERLTSLMHTLGRLVLYNHAEMSQIELQQCSYYTDLAHEIAKATRIETGIGLINEYISIANGKVPRLVQNQDRENAVARKARLDEAYKMASSILNVEDKLHENGVYRQVDGTDYTKLNAYKYMLKVNCKRLKDVPQVDRELVISLDAIYVCQNVLKIAKNNSHLDMAPQCIVHCGKFYAAMGMFKECFPAFEDGFECKKTKSFGATHLKAWRPDAFAWAVSNLARAMEAYIPLHEADLKAKLHLVVERCKQVLTEDVSVEWKKKTEKWIEVFEKEMSLLVRVK
uniref:Uncharacterized protein LOC100180356 n=1 Tax=Phallusia mammillata TaxID=59560 RepID=A0A6F9DI43_9ASCI|nr:uncharacterized protein LOC100180356 [Phallusia mammillata]